jgi:cephalosporin-C deacetylase
MRPKSILVLVLSFVLLGTSLCLAETAKENGELTLQLASDGGLEITSPSYRARIGADGNFHSLRVGDTEMLDDKVSFSVGAFFCAGGPKRLGKITLIVPPSIGNAPAPANVRAVRATDGVYTTDYLFLPGEIRLTIYHRGDKPLLYWVVFSDEIAQAMNSRSGEIAGIPAEEAWADVTLSARSGAYLALRGGDRIWGPFNDRQVCELGPIPGGEIREITISPGVGAPPQPTPDQLLNLQVALSGKQSIFGAGEAAELSIAINNRGEAIPESHLEAQFNAKDGGNTIAELFQALPIKAKAETNSRFDIAALEPGIYVARVKLFSQSRVLKEKEVILAFRPEDIKPPLSQPSDFDVFWGKTVVEAKTPAGDLPVEFKENATYSTPEVKVWEVGFNGAKGERLFGWLCIPTRSGLHPALLQLPIYGLPKIDPPVVLAGRGYVAFAPSVVPDKADIAYITQGLEDPNTYYYRDIVINSLRALEVLLSRPEVDAKRVVVSGAAQGGGLALILAALEPEAVAAVAADAPMLCDLRRSVTKGGWPYSEIARYLAANPGRENGVWRTLDYFDVMNFAPKVKSPALISLGLKDPICLPETIFAAYNYLPAAKEIKVYAEAGHEGGGSAHWLYKLGWLDKILPTASENAAPTDEGQTIELPAPEPPQP